MNHMPKLSSALSRIKIIKRENLESNIFGIHVLVTDEKPPIPECFCVRYCHRYQILYLFLNF